MDAAGRDVDIFVAVEGDSAAQQRRFSASGVGTGDGETAIR